jgi:tRNA1Val (adenine37-N6)-methyltransferase
MGQPYFQFKEFRVYHDRSTLKVTTDACLFGAWLDPRQAKNILDVGTGSGLLSLMMAQRCEATIDAIEKDEASAIQADANFSRSPWAERLQVINGDFFNQSLQQNYDLLVINPPFYQNTWLSANEQKNKAMQSTAFQPISLLSRSNELLGDSGRLAIMWPEFQFREFEKQCKSLKWGIEKQLLVRNNATSGVLRIFGLFRKNHRVLKHPVEEICIRNKDDEYSEPFRMLLSDYYLNF